MVTLIVKTPTNAFLQIMKAGEDCFCNFCGEDKVTIQAFVQNAPVGDQDGLNVADICEDCATQIVEIFKNNVPIPGQVEQEEKVPF